MPPDGLSDYPHNPQRVAIAARLLEWMSADLPGTSIAPITPGHDAANDDAFNDLALEVFRYQFDRCEAFRRLCAARGCGRGAGDYRDIPCIPTDAFKLQRIACFPESPVEIVFLTSGTTQGRPGRHVLPSTELYDAAAMPRLLRHLLPDWRAGDAAPRFISLTGSPAAMPHSSLVHMIGAAGRRVSETVDYFFSMPAADGGAGEGLLFDDLMAVVRDCIQIRRPVLLFTTAFALVHWLDALTARNEKISLPPGSRMMETGGYKGLSRELARDDLYRWAADRLGLPERSIVNEYGMTEMSSQFYDRTLAEPGMADREARIKLPPPWVRSITADPCTGRPVGEGEIGILRHIDLANLDTCAFLAMPDAARRVGRGFDLIGRLPEAGARGCSLDYEG